MKGIVYRKEQCCGCGACAQKCPQHCISMIEDEEGFCYPVVDNDKCVKCEMCFAVCPFGNPKEERKPLKAFAAYHKDDVIRKNSSSGGIFSLLAEKVLLQQGVVFGAMFNGCWDVVHGFVEHGFEIEKLRGSKYVQSNIGDCFTIAQSFLKEGRMVLFSGTPCQIAGLQLFLGRDYDNLLAVDFICHGVPSPKVWRWYLKQLEKECRSTIKEICFRNKDYGWKNYGFYVGFENGEKSEHFHGENPYMKAFLNNLTLRPSCSFCVAKSGQSHSDITLADFWNVDKVVNGLDDDKGVSLVMGNSRKGIDALKSLCDGSFQEVDFSESIQYNKAWGESYPSNDNRKRFFKSYQNHGNDFDDFVRMEPSQIGRFEKSLKNCIRRLLALIRA